MLYNVNSIDRLFNDLYKNLEEEIQCRIDDIIDMGYLSKLKNAIVRKFAKDGFIESENVKNALEKGIDDVLDMVDVYCYRYDYAIYGDKNSRDYSELFDDDPKNLEDYFYEKLKHTELSKLFGYDRQDSVEMRKMIREKVLAGYWEIFCDRETEKIVFVKAL